MLTRDDMQRAPVGVRLALWRYVEAGGTLVVLGGHEPPRTDGLLGQTEIEGMTAFYAGFGVCFPGPGQRHRAPLPPA